VSAGYNSEREKEMKGRKFGADARGNGFTEGKIFARSSKNVKPAFVIGHRKHRDKENSEKRSDKFGARMRTR